MIFSTLALFSSAAAAPAPIDINFSGMSHEKLGKLKSWEDICRKEADGIKKGKPELADGAYTMVYVEKLPRIYAGCSSENTQLVCGADGILRKVKCENGHWGNNF